MLMKALSNRMLRFRLEAEVWVVLFFLRWGLGLGLGLVHTSEHTGHVVQIKILYVSFKLLNGRAMEERLVSCHMFHCFTRCL